MKTNDLTIKAVLFDFDGTLTQPGALDFTIIKEAIGCPSDIPVLEFIRQIKNPTKQAKSKAALESFETTGAANSVPALGAESLIAFLRKKHVPMGIITRNSRKSVLRALENFKRTNAADFDLIISRDDDFQPKPHPAGILYAAKYFNVTSDCLLMVGDYRFDIEAGNLAKTPTVLVTENAAAPGFSCQPDFTVDNLDQLKKIIEMYLPLPAGKFPNELLGQYLDGLSFDDPQLLVRPGIGEDTAAIDAKNEDVLIFKTDPITFATDAIGQYAVLVNANDIATAGADPRWLLITAIFPCQTTPAKIIDTLQDITFHCRKWGITLCGGHTEISDAVNRPIISGMMTGTVKGNQLVDKSNIQPGDQIFVTKAAAVEGTAIIAREFPQRLMEAGLSLSEIDYCRSFIDRISILAEAKIARAIPGVSGMHDVTEGGLVTAIWELGAATKCQLKIDWDQLPIYAETKKICDLMGIDPLGLIGSGSLLICCRSSNCEDLIHAIREASIDITPIGEVLSSGEGVRATQWGQPIPWPSFSADELTRLF